MYLQRGINYRNVFKFYILVWCITVLDSLGGLQGNRDFGLKRD